MAYRYAKQPANVITGDCMEAKKAEKRGALDEQGQSAPEKYPGWTRPEVAVKVTPVGNTTYKQDGWVCNQDQAVYPTKEKCFLNCNRAGLGGPLIVDCVRGVVATQKARVQVVYSQRTWALVWKTNCAEGKRWNTQIRDHEAVHRADHEKIVKDWSAKNATKTFTGRGSSEAGAQADVKEKMSTWADKASDELVREFKKAGDGFHKTAAGAPAFLDCSKCP